MFQSRNLHCRETNQELHCQKNSGFNIPARQLKKCIAHSDEVTLKHLYHDMLKQSALRPKKSLASKFFLRANPREKALNDYIFLIVFNSLPPSTVEDQNIRTFSKHTERFSRKTIKRMIFKLTGLVEKQISQELQAATNGKILQDG